MIAPAADPAAVSKQIQSDDETVRIPQGRMIDCIKLRYASGTFAHIDLRGTGGTP
ncbi:MAG: hypothetical protein K4571_16750 [Deltaproteobacteria bacterium]